uniref:Ion transport domain-containing protein n=1 Tax=Panagrolaimus superbus TaxID=310955 RepID=A0A914YJW3_9BILA
MLVCFQLIIIWITTVVCFAFSFQHVMRESNVYPWDSNINNNVTLNESTIQSFTKVSVMMIGEIDANDIINKREIIASVILVLFEIIVIIILMNLMMSLAVDDVSKLYDFAEEKLLHIKVNYCIEILHLSQYSCRPWLKLHKMQVRNIMIDSKQHKYQFSKRLIDKTQDGSLLFYEIYPKSSFSGGSTLSINDVLIQKLNRFYIKDGSLEKEAFKNYLSGLENDERTCQKFRRLFIGLNFQYCSAKKCDCKCCRH